MSTFKVEFRTGNAAFADNEEGSLISGNAVAGILHRIADQVGYLTLDPSSGPVSASVRDENSGTVIGWWEHKEDGDMTEDEILREAEQIRQQRDKQQQDAFWAQYRARMEKNNQRARAFAESTGVTWEQFEEIENYVREHLDD